MLATFTEGRRTFKSKLNLKLANYWGNPSTSPPSFCIYFRSSAKLIIQLVQNSFHPTVCCYGYQLPRLSHELHLIVRGGDEGEWTECGGKVSVLVSTRYSFAFVACCGCIFWEATGGAWERRVLEQIAHWHNCNTTDRKSLSQCCI